MANITQIQRYLYTIRYIRNIHKTPTLLQILDYVNEQIQFHESSSQISDKTLRRDIDNIKRHLGLGIEYDYGKRYYHIPDDENKNSIIEELLESFEILNSIGGEDGKPDYIIPEKRKAKGSEYFNPLKQAIKNRKQIKLLYKKFYPEETKEYTIEPQALKQSKGRWYLIGLDYNKNFQIKSFALDRIFAIALLQTKCTNKNITNWDEEYKHTFAMFNPADAPQKVVFECDLRDGQYIESMPIHSSQKTVFHNDKTVVELFIKITLDFKMELMSRAWSIKVIEPISLRNDLHKIFREASERNA